MAPLASSWHDLTSVLQLLQLLAVLVLIGLWLEMYYRR